jgi:hypothetical protein
MNNDIKFAYDAYFSNPLVSEEYIEKHIEDFNIEELAKTRKFSEEFIIKHDNRINLIDILKCQDLSDKYYDYLENKYSSPNDYFIKLIEWKYICIHQKLTKELIVKYIHNINFDFLKYNKNIDDETKEFCKTFI